MGGGKQDPPMDVAAPWYRISAFDAKKGTLLWQTEPGYRFISLANGEREENTPLIGTRLLAYQDHGKVRTLHALNATNGSTLWQADLPCHPGSCQMPSAVFDRGMLYLLVRDDPQPRTKKTSGPYHLLAFDLSRGQKMADHALPTPSYSLGLLGASDGRAYVRENAAEQTVIRALSLSDGQVLWDRTENPAPDSLEIAAP